MVADAYGNAVGSGRFVSASSGVSGSVPARTTNGVLSNTASSATNGAVTGVNPGGSGDTAGVVGIGDSGTHGLMGMAFAPGYHAVFGFAPFPGFVSAIDQQGKLVFFGSSAASNRNAQLKELFQSMPTSDPFVAGELWNDGGVVKISSG